MKYMSKDFKKITLDKTIRKTLKELDKVAVAGILTDPELYQLLQQFFTDEKEKKCFIKKCLRRLKTRRMLLRLQWYIQIANDMRKVRESRPALCLIFLMSLAEAMAKQRTGQQNLRSHTAVKEFFVFIRPEDRQQLQRGFRKTLLHPKVSRLRFSSIVKILYNVRNSAVHGEDFWTFSLLSQEEKKKYQEEHYTHYGMLTSGFLVEKYSRKRRKVSLDVALTYEDLRDIFINTAIANIKALL